MKKFFQSFSVTKHDTTRDKRTQQYQLPKQRNFLHFLWFVCSLMSQAENVNEQQKQVTKRERRERESSWITPWSWFEDPWGEFRQMQRELNRFFRDFPFRDWPLSRRSELATWAPRVDVSETGMFFKFLSRHTFRSLTLSLTFTIC
jgi:hypothetical protein